VLGRALAHGLLGHGIVPPNFTLDYDWLPAAAAIAGGVAAALLAVLAAGRRAARVPPTLALTDAAAEPRLLGPGRLIGGLLALAGAVPLFTVSATTTTPETAAATSELNAIFLVVAAAFLGPVVPYVAARLLAPPLAALSPVGGFLAAANLGADDIIPAQILAGGQGGGLDAGVIAGSLSALHGDAIALGRHRADAAHARIGDRVAIMLGDGTRTRATVVAIYTRDLAFGDALLASELAAGHQTTPLLSTILIRTDRPAATAPRLQALAQRYPGLRVRDSAALVTAADADRELNHWLGPFFVVMIFAFTSIAVLNTLTMIALRRRRELALLRLTGATTRQVRSMARWEAILIITIGLGIGLAIAATALLPLSRAFTGGFRPYAPAGWLTAILGLSALLALVALSVPTRRALRARPVQAIGIRE
jgi:putative ABC transport system permease protein